MSEYTSAFAPYIENLVQLKRNLGYKYRASALKLLQVDKFAVQMHVVEPIVTKDFAEEWCKQRPNETNSTRYGRAHALSQLSNYLTAVGKLSYKPCMPKLNSTFVPYIFSHNETPMICGEHKHR